MIKKRGVTLVELVVAMGIFGIFMTLAVGAYVTTLRIKRLTSTMRETQQKTRIAVEMISRISRQAEIVTISSDGNMLDTYYFINGDKYGAKFFITSDGKLKYREYSEGNWGDEFDLYGGIYLQNETPNDSSFEKLGTSPTLLNIKLYGKIGDLVANPYYSSEININTAVILENLK